MANFWQKIFENGKIFGKMDFLLQNGNFLAIFISFHIFSILLHFLSLSIKTKVCSKGIKMRSQKAKYILWLL